MVSQSRFAFQRFPQSRRARLKGIKGHLRYILGCIGNFLYKNTLFKTSIEPL